MFGKKTYSSEMNEANNKIPFARMKNGQRYTAYQMSKERYAYNMKWRGFLCPVEGCNRHLKWTQCSVRGKFWSHKQLKRGEVVNSSILAAHTGETFSHLFAKAKVVDHLSKIELKAKKCNYCDERVSYSFSDDDYTAKAEYTILKGVRADVAVFKGEKLIAVISIVHTHEREPEKWKKIYDELGILVFEIPAKYVISDDFPAENQTFFSHIYAHWGRCPECTVVEEERLEFCRREPQYVIEDGRHITELSTEELVKFWRMFHSKKDEETKLEKVKNLLREQKKCFCCGISSAEDLCENCEMLKTSTTCKMCGELTKTKWRVHCVKCCNIINSTKCKRCKEPTHSSWKKHCTKCYLELQEQQKRRIEEERRRIEEERRRIKEKMQRCNTCGKRKKYEWSLYCVSCYYKAKEQEEEEERQKKLEEELRTCSICLEPKSVHAVYCNDCEDAIHAEKERRKKREEEERRKKLEEEEERRKKLEEEERRRQEEQRKKDIAWKKKDREDRRLGQQRRMIEEEEKRRYWEERRRKQKLKWEQMEEENRKRKVQRMKEEELQEKLKEQAKQRQKEKARKKRQEEKEIKVYKQTNQDYQKMINDNRSDFGLPKKKVQKTMANFFKK